jgi:predicted  nucleic acid-binding Zn-ribbon protein
MEIDSWRNRYQMLQQECQKMNGFNANVQSMSTEIEQLQSQLRQKQEEISKWSLRVSQSEHNQQKFDDYKGKYQKLV